MIWNRNIPAMFYLLFCLGLISLCIMGCGKQKKAEDKIFRSEMTIRSLPTTMKAKSVNFIDVNLKCLNGDSWKNDAEHLLFLSYHWYYSDGKWLTWDGIRTALPDIIASNKETPVSVKVQAPDLPGEYILEFDMTQEHVDGWLSKNGLKTIQTKVKVE